jgi:hypothetical protein
MKETAVEWLVDQIKKDINVRLRGFDIDKALEKAKKMEKKQLFLSANIQAKQAYKAGQKSMYCGCYEISGCTSFEDWLYNKTFKTE